MHAVEVEHTAWHGPVQVEQTHVPEPTLNTANMYLISRDSILSSVVKKELIFAVLAGPLLGSACFVHAVDFPRYTMSALRVL
jgi:hypothetical protein